MIRANRLKAELQTTLHGGDELAETICGDAGEKQGK
jgi:hypothetical protein